MSKRGQGGRNQRGNSQGKQGKHGGQGQGGNRNDPPPWWQAPETLGEAKRQAYQETLPEYLPVIRQKQREAAASKRRTGEVGNWWNEYLQTVAGVQGETQKAYADAAAQTQGMIGQSSAADTAATGQLNSEAAASAAARGQTAPTAAIGNRAAAAQGQRNYLASAAGALTANRGANQFAYLGEQKRIGAGQRVKSMMDEQGRTRGIKEDLLAAKKERGAQAVKNLGALRTAYQEQELKEKAFSLDDKKLRNEKAEALADQELKEHENAEDRHQNQVENKQKQRELNEDQKTREHDEAQDNKEVKAKKGNAWATAVFLYERGPKKGKTWKSWAALEAAVAKEAEINGAEAHRAVQNLAAKVKREEREAAVKAAEDPNGASMGR
jgi:hypothetical protein